MNLGSFKDFIRGIKREHLILLGILILNIVLRMQFLHEPFERDEGTYSMLGQEILRGAIPYRDALEIKPPGLMYIYAAMIGIFGIETTEGIRIATAFYVLGTVLSVYWLGKKLFGEGAGLASALLYAVYSTTPFLQGSSSNGENFMVLPVMVTACFLLQWLDTGKRRYLLLCGFFSWIALIIKPVALPHVALLCLMIGWHQLKMMFAERFRRSSISNAALTVLSYSILPLLLYGLLILYLHLNDALDDAIYWNYTFLKSYSSATPSEAYSRFRNTFDTITPEHIMLWIAALPSFLWLLMRRNARSVFTALMLPAALIGLSLPKHFYPHYFIQMIPPLALIAGIGIASLWQTRRMLFYCVTPILVAAAAYSFSKDYKLYFVYTPEQVCIEKYGSQGVDFVDSVEVSRYIKERSLPGDYVFQWGNEPQIYFMTGLPSPSKYCSDQAAFWAQDPPRAFQSQLTSLTQNKPRFIVLQKRTMSNAATPLIKSIIHADYSFAYAIGNFVVFRHRGLVFDNHMLRPNN